MSRVKHVQYTHIHIYIHLNIVYICTQRAFKPSPHLYRIMIGYNEGAVSFLYAKTYKNDTESYYRLIQLSINLMTCIIIDLISNVSPLDRLLIKTGIAFLHFARALSSILDVKYSCLYIYICPFFSRRLPVARESLSSICPGNKYRSKVSKFFERFTRRTENVLARGDCIDKIIRCVEKK